jgi:hypothetical protein
LAAKKKAKSAVSRAKRGSAAKTVPQAAIAPATPAAAIAAIPAATPAAIHPLAPPPASQPVIPPAGPQPTVVPLVQPAAPAPVTVTTPVGYAARRRLLSRLERERKSKVLLYVTGDRPGWQTQISAEAVDHFTDHLDATGVTKKITLVLYTQGGDTLAAWNIVNLIRQFCDELEVIVPAKCLSAGTLMSLSANKIVMTKQATLGPIDPSIMGPLNPMIPGAANARAPVSVEAIRGYLDLATKELGIKDGGNLTQIFTFLSQQIHPLVLGQIFRSKTQIQYLARRLLSHQVSDAKKIDTIIAFLCSDSGSHDYTINRREARELGLNVETPSEELYTLIRNIHLSFRAELALNEPYDPSSLIGNHPQALYSFRRCLIESVRNGCNAFVSDGVLAKAVFPGPGGILQQQNTDTRTFEGWKKLA